MQYDLSELQGIGGVAAVKRVLIWMINTDAVADHEVYTWMGCADVPNYAAGLLNAPGDDFVEQLQVADAEAFTLLRAAERVGQIGTLEVDEPGQLVVYRPETKLLVAALKDDPGILARVCDDRDVCVPGSGVPGSGVAGQPLVVTGPGGAYRREHYFQTDRPPAVMLAAGVLAVAMIALVVAMVAMVASSLTGDAVSPTTRQAQPEAKESASMPHGRQHHLLSLPEQAAAVNGTR